MPRRSTRGPLDLGESPISPNTPTTPSNLAHQSSSLLSPSASQYATPRLQSPQPGSNLSTLTSPSFRTAKSSLSPSHSTLSTTQKDFSFLLRPEIYHPLTLLDVPPPFRVASAQPDPSTSLPDLVSQGHFRSAAIKAAQLLTSPLLNPSDHTQIFNLVYTRLSCLTLCNQTTLASQEVKALEDLNAIYYRNDLDGQHLVPWELRVLAVRLQGMGFNDARRGIMGYYDLAREARLTLTSLKKSRKEIPDDAKIQDEIKKWKARLSELGIRVASALIEMEDLEGATRFLGTLKSAGDEEKRELEVRKALLWLCLGDVEAARGCIAALSTETENDSAYGGQVILALAHMADSDFSSAVTIWEELISSASSSAPEGEIAMCKQNLGVCLLYLGRMDAAREILETLTDERNSFHALTFNLSTIYELCTERSRALKISLAEKIAGMQGEEGRKVGWEKVNGDFKL
ncbi:hypothetical protein EG329_012779 [Mollisiaceae sp. DMI_Dod_QoI]|nr:hypothetical protein EG329_012779 [Helotiales sp. DMI_Dod_QoI]